jgi:dihydrofolate reductase
VAVGRIRVHEFMSLDGVVENPAWTFEFGFDPAMGEDLAGLTGPSKGILLGRTTWEMFAPAWSTRSPEDDPGVPFFNDTPKHVVSSTLTDTSAWQNSSVLGPYDPDALRRLKDDGDLYVSGSVTLVRAMLADGLVDELHLFVYPVALGEGLRMFGDGERTKLALLESRAYDNGVLHLSYGPAAT